MAANLDQKVVIEGSEGDQFAVHSTQSLNLGQEMRFIDGRRFRYARAGAVAVVPGKLYQAPIPVAAHVLQTAAAAAVGARTVALTLGATATTADQYRDGYLVVDLSTNTGFGYMYQIGAHPVIDASSVFNVPLRSPVQVAIATTANSISLVR
jgi:phage baseplate assembly protein gpV